jgi:hypothetical protein
MVEVSGNVDDEQLCGEEVKQIICRCHCRCHIDDGTFRDLRLDQIGAGEVAAFRASLVERKRSEKRINNTHAVLAKPMKYAVDCELISKSPKIGMFKVERPEIVAGDFFAVNPWRLRGGATSGSTRPCATCMSRHPIKASCPRWCSWLGMGNTRIPTMPPARGSRVDD